MTKEVCEKLLLVAPPPVIADAPSDDILPPGYSDGLAIVSGYPEYPLYHRLSDAMAYWMITG